MRALVLGLFATCAGVLLSSCAMQGQVQRFNVEYNTAVAGMADQLTLLNIARAKEGVPTFYTSVSRITGTITVKATANIASQLKADQPTSMTSTTNQAATGSGTSLSNMTGSGTSGSLSNVTGGATPTSTAMGGSTTSLSNTTGSTTSATNTITSLVQSAVTRGGNVYTPTIGGEIDSGPSFDVNILDTQEFYQGILTAVEPAVLMNYLDQGVDGDLIFYLLTARIDFLAGEDTDVQVDDAKGGKKTLHITKGEVIDGLTNASLDFTPASTGSLNQIMASEFWPKAACYVLQTKASHDPDQKIALASKVFDQSDGKSSLKLSDLTTIDGTQLALAPIASPAAGTLYIGSPTVSDDKILLVRPSQSREVLALSVRPAADDVSCDPPEVPDIAGMKPAEAKKALDRAASKYAFWNGARFAPEVTADARSGSASDRGEVVFYAKGRELYRMKAKVDVVLRSPEGVVQYVGAYARFFDGHEVSDTDALGPFAPYELNKQPLFILDEGKRCSDEVVGVNLLKQHYCVPRGLLRRDMKVIALIEQLVNLHKSAKDRPTTLPVQVVP